MPTYRDPETSWDETHDGDSVIYPESFVICDACGVAVYDQKAHNEHHEALSKLINALGTLKDMFMRHTHGSNQ